MTRLSEALAAVLAERGRQEAKCAQKRAEGLLWLTCADPRMPDGDKLAVLMEEVGEVAQELCEARAAKGEPGPNLRVELVQVAAVALAWVEALDAAGVAPLIGPERSEGPHLARRTLPPDAPRDRQRAERVQTHPDTLPAKRGFPAFEREAPRSVAETAEPDTAALAARYGGGRTA